MSVHKLVFVVATAILVCCQPEFALCVVGPVELPSTSIVSDSPENQVFIHIRSVRQQTIAKRIKEKLQEDGYSVPRIILVTFGPKENEVRYFHRDRFEASIVLQDVRALGLGRIALKSIGHYESNPRGRYELWLSPHTR